MFNRQPALKYKIDSRSNFIDVGGALFQLLKTPEPIRSQYGYHFFCQIRLCWMIWICRPRVVKP